MRRKTGPYNNSDATPTGGAWEGLDSIATGSQVGSLCLIPIGAEPGLGQEYQVDCIVVNVLGDFTTFSSVLMEGALNNATRSPDTEE